MGKSSRNTKKINFCVGDKVRLLGVPDWLLNGLPEDEQVEIISFIWDIFEIIEIDEYNYIWLGDEAFIEKRGDGVMYGKPTFCITEEYIKINEK